MLQVWNPILAFPSPPNEVEQDIHVIFHVQCRSYFTLCITSRPILCQCILRLCQVYNYFTGDGSSSSKSEILQDLLGQKHLCLRYAGSDWFDYFVSLSQTKRQVWYR